MKKRFWACFLSLSLVLTMMPTMAFATDETVDEPADTSEVCTVTDGCTLQTGHEGDCVVTEPEQKEPESMPCTLTQGCTLEADHEGECVTAESMTELPTAAINSTTENDGAGIKQSFLSGYCGGDTTANSNSYPYGEDKTQYVYDNLTWQLTENGSNTYTLSITGNGVMANWAYIEGGIRNAVISSPWSEYSNRITEIDLNGNIQLGDRAFQGLSALTAFDFPEGITKIPTYAFADCVSLENITIPDTVTEIGTAAFRACDAFTSISIPESVTTYGEHLFYSCHNLQDVHLPSNLENLPGYMFRDCVALEEITFPDGLTSIGIGAFEGCTSLKYLELSSGLKSIDASAFKNCTNLEDVDLSNTQLEEIPENLFQGISGLKSVKLPDTVKKIGNHAFADTGITQLMLPPQVDWIYGYALDGCSNIIAVTMATEPFEEYEDTTGGVGGEYWQRIGSQLFLDIAENSIVYLVGDKIPLAFTGTYYNNRIDGTKTSLALTNGGTFAEDTVFESGKLTKPTKVGYLFAGWYTTNDFQEESKVADDTAEPGQIYYAKWEIDTDTTWYGDGTAQTYYISTAAQLAGLAKLVNDGNNFEGKTIELSADIDLNNIDWKPIGTSDKPFKGEFDGNSHSISNFVISDSAATYQGLFGYCESAKIYNFSITDVDIVCDYRGGIVAGVASGSTFDNIKIYDSTIDGQGHIGGLIGRVQTMSTGDSTVIITNCDMQNVSVRAMSVADSWNDTVDNNDSSNKVDSVTPFSTRCGGITSITVNAPLVISGCDLENVTVKSWGCAGGLVGMAYGSSSIVSIEKSSFSGTVDSKSGGATAGLATGSNNAEIKVDDCRVEATLDGNEVDQPQEYCEYPFISTGVVKNSTADVIFTRTATIFPSSDSTTMYNSAEDCTVNAKFAADIAEQCFLGYTVYPQSTTFKNCTVAVELTNSDTDVTLSAYRRVNNDTNKDKNTTYVGCTLLIRAGDTSPASVETGVGGTSPLYVDFDFPVTITPSKNQSSIDANTIAVLDGGIFAEDTEFTANTLATPIKDSYIFEGWYTMDGTDGEWGELAETISEGKTYYAKWTPSTYKVTEDLDFGEVVYGSTASQVIEVSGSDVAGALKVADNDIFETVVNENNTITVTPRSNLSVGEYEETLYVTTPDNATFFVPVTLEVVRAGSELAIWANGAENLSLSGGGNVTLTIKGDLDADEVTVTCDNENIEVTENADDTYTVTLPNETAEYTFTATYEGDHNHEAAQDTCTVSVTRHTGGGGASHPEASDDSSSNRNDRDDDDTENIDEEDVPLTEGKVADFDDVPADAWFAEAVQYVYEHDLMTGVSENLFAPNAQMNRAMVAQILFNVEKPADTEAPVAFRDVAADQWYAKAVNWAVWQGYMSGYGAGSFGPNDALTREQLVTVLWRYSGSPVMGDSSMLNTFSDAAMTSDYAQQAMTWAYAQGVISGNADGTLNPQGTATRAEVATILMRFYENMAE